MSQEQKPISLNIKLLTIVLWQPQLIVLVRRWLFQRRLIEGPQQSQFSPNSIFIHESIIPLWHPTWRNLVDKFKHLFWTNGGGAALIASFQAAIKWRKNDILSETFSPLCWLDKSEPVLSNNETFVNCPHWLRHRSGEVKKFRAKKKFHSIIF